MTREEKTIDDLAATLLDIIHLAGVNGTGLAIRKAAHEAIERLKADHPWPRLNNPDPPPRPMPGIDF